nr:hypothetical protein [Tanacetum cinerariifolium]
MIDYAPWEVIENDATFPKTQVVESVTTEMPITPTEEKAQKRLEVKGRSTLMMGISNELQLKFNSIKDANKLLEAIEKRFEMFDQTFDRLQKLVSQLELLKEKLLQEDVNQNLLRSLSPEWNTHVVVWRNKADLDTMSMDDLYNNLKVYEPEVKGMYSLSSSTQNMDFVSSTNNNTSNTNGTVNTAQAVNTADGVFTAGTQVNTAYSTNIDNLNEFVNKHVVENCKAKSNEEETKVVRKNDDAQIIKEYVSDNEKEDVSQPKIKKKTVRPSIAKI